MKRGRECFRGRLERCVIFSPLSHNPDWTLALARKTKWWPGLGSSVEHERKSACMRCLISWFESQGRGGWQSGSQWPAVSTCMATASMLRSTAREKIEAFVEKGHELGPRCMYVCPGQPSAITLSSRDMRYPRDRTNLGGLGRTYAVLVQPTSPAPNAGVSIALDCEWPLRRGRPSGEAGERRVEGGGCSPIARSRFSNQPGRGSLAAACQ